MPKKQNSIKDEGTWELLNKSLSRIVGELEREPRGFKFSDQRRQELREKILFGFADWAFRKMGNDFDKYVAEGENNFELVFIRRGYSDENRFWKSFEETSFTIPQKIPRRAIHPVYIQILKIRSKHALARIGPKYIPRETERCEEDYLRELKNALPDMDKNRLEALVKNKAKRSDIAIAYAIGWLRSKHVDVPVDIEAVKKYFEHFPTIVANHLAKLE